MRHFLILLPSRPGSWEGQSSSSRFALVFVLFALGVLPSRTNGGPNRLLYLFLNLGKQVREHDFDWSVRHWQVPYFFLPTELEVLFPGRGGRRTKLEGRRPFVVQTVLYTNIGQTSWHFSSAFTLRGGLDTLSPTKLWSQLTRSGWWRWERSYAAGYQESRAMQQEQWDPEACPLGPTLDLKLQKDCSPTVVMGLVC